MYFQVQKAAIRWRDRNLIDLIASQDVKEGGIEDGVPRIRFKEGRSPGKAQMFGKLEAPKVASPQA